MRLLITTQTVDKDDPVLGFFHGWLLEFAKHFEHISVICLKEGVHTLPPNVRVYSLGKESGENRFKYLVRFYTHVWRLRNECDHVFSHMNPHYIVLAGWLWKYKGIEMSFWRNHAKMNLKTKIAAWYAKNVFYTSPYACTRIFPHSIQMPVGIDTNVFLPQENIPRNERSVLFLGRISPVKHPETFIDAGRECNDLNFHIYGDASHGQSEYHKKLEQYAAGYVTFHKGIPNYKTPSVYSAFDIYVNLTPEGSMDKTVLEAAACGALPIVVNKSFVGILPDVCVLSETTQKSLVERIQKFVLMSSVEKQTYRIQMRDAVQRDHSLQKLATELKSYFTGHKKRQ